MTENAPLLAVVWRRVKRVARTMFFALGIPVAAVVYVWLFSRLIGGMAGWGEDTRGLASFLTSAAAACGALIVGGFTIRAHGRTRETLMRDRVTRALGAVTSSDVLHARSVVGATAVLIDSHLKRAPDKPIPGGVTSELRDATFSVLWAIEQAGLSADLSHRTHRATYHELALLYRHFDRMTESLRSVLLHPTLAREAASAVEAADATLARFSELIPAKTLWADLTGGDERKNGDPIVPAPKPLTS